MTRKERWTWVGLAIVAALALLVIAEAVGAVDATFMPKGGKALLTERLGAPAKEAQLRGVVTARRSEAQWTDYLAAQGDVSGRDLATLAAYLAANAPVAPGVAARTPLALSLPPDGRELAWNDCQNCHSLFHAYLGQTRDAASWRKVLASPAHRGLKLTAAEREEIARYGELNMPMPPDTIPAQLRR